MEVGGQRRAPAALPPAMTRYPFYRRLGGSQGRAGRLRKILPPPRFDPQNEQPVASCYNDWAIPAHNKLIKLQKFKSYIQATFVMQEMNTQYGCKISTSVRTGGAQYPGGARSQWRTKCCTAVSNICVSSVRNLVYVNSMGPRILRQLLDFRKIYAPLSSRHKKKLGCNLSCNFFFNLSIRYNVQFT